MGRSKIKGIGPLRRMMKRLPDSMRGEMIVELNLEGRQALAEMQARAPRRSGRLATALAFKVFPKTLRLQVGILRKKQRRDLFYAHILNYGRRAQSVSVTRSTTKVYAKPMRVSAIRATNFINDPAGRLRERVRRSLPRIYERALRRAATGGGSD